MSAFVVDPATIKTIVKALELAVQGEGRYPATFPDMRYIKGCEELREAAQNDPAELGRTLYAMNINAVEQRYPGDRDLPGTYDEDDRIAAFVYDVDPWASPDPVKVYKSLGCYLYQCSEGDVPELPLFKAVSAFKVALAEHIVEGMPEYDKAEWG